MKVFIAAPIVLSILIFTSPPVMIASMSLKFFKKCKTLAPAYCPIHKRPQINRGHR